MGSRQSEDVVTVIAAAEVKADGALIVGHLERRYIEAKGGRKRVAELGDGVNEGIEGWELGATAGEARRPLADGDINVGEAGLAEDDTLYVLSGGLGLLEGDSHGRHADGHQERAEGGLLSNVGKAEACDHGALDPASIEVCIGIPEDLGPGGCDGVVVHWACLTDERLRFGTAYAFRPGLARLVNEWSPADRAVSVREGVWVVVGKT